MTYCLTKHLLVAILLIGAIVSAQTPSRQALRSQLDSLEVRYQQASTTSGNLSRRADSLAAVVQQRKSKKSTNLLSDRALADELRRAQNLANQLQTARQVQAVQLDSLIRKAEQTLKILNGEVTRLTVQFSAAKLNGNRVLQKNLAEELRETTQLRQRCQTLLQNVPAPAPLIEVRVDPHDPPEVFAQKADFLLDQADRLRRSAAQVEAKSNQLRQEVTMRERLADFVEDLRVFDPTAETPRSVGQSGVLRDKAASTDFNAQPGRVEDIANLSQAVLANDRLWPEDIAQLSDTELRKWITRLESQRRHWLAQADSLSQRAQEIRKSISAKSDDR